MMSSTATAKRRVGRPKGGGGIEARESIVRAARKLFSENGYRATSMSSIAAEAGLSQTGLVHHFPAKDDLLMEVLDRRNAESVSWLRLGEERGWAVLDQWTRLLERNARNPGDTRLFTTLAGEATDPEHPGHPWLRRHHEAAFNAAVRPLRAGIEDGEIDPEMPVESVARLLIAISDGLQMQWLGDPEHVDMPRDFAAFAEPIRRRWSTEQAI